MLQKHKYIKGFVDPLSLIAVGFLVLTIFIGTAVTKNKNISLNPNKEAACLEPCISNTDCGSGYFCYKPANGCPECKKTVTTNTTTTTTTNDDEEEETTKVASKFVRCCPSDNSASAINTCTGTSENACKINIKVCDPLYSTNPSAQCSQPKPSPTANSNICLEPCTKDADCGTGNYCFKPATGCPECRKTATVTSKPTTTPTATPKYCNASLLNTSGCGEGECKSSQVQQTWKTVNCETSKICVDSSTCKIPTCITEGNIVVSGTECCSGLVKTNCTSDSITPHCTCSKTPSPTSTPPTKTCIVRNCSNNYCVKNQTTIPSSEVCPFSNCAEDYDCQTKISSYSATTTNPPINTTPVCQNEFGKCLINGDCCLGLSCLREKCLEETPELIYYSQRDLQWKGAYFTCPDGTKVPFSSVGCGQTVAAMILSSYVDDSFTPDTVKENYFSQSYFCSGSGISAINDALIDNGLSIKKVTSLKMLKNSLSQGEIAIIDIKFWNGTGYTTHHSLATGVDTNGNIIFMDPWFGPNTSLEGVEYEIIGSEIIEKPTI